MNRDIPDERIMLEDAIAKYNIMYDRDIVVLDLSYLQYLRPSMHGVLLRLGINDQIDFYDAVFLSTIVKEITDNYNTDTTIMSHIDNIETSVNSRLLTTFSLDNENIKYIAKVKTYLTMTLDRYLNEYVNVNELLNYSDIKNSDRIFVNCDNTISIRDMHAEMSLVLKLYTRSRYVK